MEAQRKIRIIMTKAGLDGHDRGLKVVSVLLRDEGFEVIYTGLRQTPEAVVWSAIQEDVDVVGISCLTGNYKHLCKEVIRLLRKRGANDVVVILGGIINEAHIPSLKKMGVTAVFGPGSRIAEIAKVIRENVRR